MKEERTALSTFPLDEGKHPLKMHLQLRQDVGLVGRKCGLPVRAEKSHIFQFFITCVCMFRGKTPVTKFEGKKK